MNQTAARRDGVRVCVAIAAYGIGFANKQSPTGRAHVTTLRANQKLALQSDVPAIPKVKQP